MPESHLRGPALVQPPSGPVYRVARSSGPLAPSRIAAQEALATRALSAKMAEELADLGVEVLDVANVRGPNRLISRAASSWAYYARD